MVYADAFRVLEPDPLEVWVMGHGRCVPAPEHSQPACDPGFEVRCSWRVRGCSYMEHTPLYRIFLVPVNPVLTPTVDKKRTAIMAVLVYFGGLPGGAGVKIAPALERDAPTGRSGIKTQIGGIVNLHRTYRPRPPRFPSRAGIAGQIARCGKRRPSNRQCGRPPRRAFWNARGGAR